MTNERTLVKVSAGEHCIGFRTVSRKRKSPQRFLIIRRHLEKLEFEQTAVVSDIHSFAELRLNESTRMLTINFTWLSSHYDGLKGWEDLVTIPYDKLLEFMRESTQENGPENWSQLSLCTVSRPKLVFHDQKRLRECVENKVVRGKLSHALRDHFKSPYAEQIDFYHDFAPYSFLFREVCNGRDGIVGGLILHNYDSDLKRSHYSVHT